MKKEKITGIGFSEYQRCEKESQRFIRNLGCKLAD